MPRFSNRSKERLATCDQRLQDVMNMAIETFDFTVLEGHRTLERQKELVAKGFSKTMHSRHLTNPSRAVDVAPWPIDWEDIPRFVALSHTIKSCANELGVEIEWGGDWHTFRDYPHYQVEEN